MFLATCKWVTESLRDIFHYKNPTTGEEGSFFFAIDEQGNYGYMKDGKFKKFSGEDPFDGKAITVTCSDTQAKKEYTIKNDEIDFVMHGIFTKNKTTTFFITKPGYYLLTVEDKTYKLDLINNFNQNSFTLSDLEQVT